MHTRRPSVIFLAAVCARHRLAVRIGVRLADGPAVLGEDGSAGAGSRGVFFDRVLWVGSRSLTRVVADWPAQRRSPAGVLSGVG